MSNSKYMGSSYPGHPGGGPYVTFMNSGGYAGQEGGGIVQIHRGQEMELSPDLQSPGHDSVRWALIGQYCLLIG